LHWSSLMERSMSANRRLVFGILGALCGTLALAGCYTETGLGYSADQTTYVSSTWQPKTVTIYDTRTQEAIWSVDIPVGQKLTVDFGKGNKGQSELMPDKMRWRLMPEGQLGGDLVNEMPVPPPSARLVQLTLRPAPEYPGQVIAEQPTDVDEVLVPADEPMNDSETDAPNGEQSPDGGV
ncbi:MAG: hypothetical protein VYC34_02630, partial [Planctomycetota bacterium]|nr:hypothetical protein [Planctomycetota bacterium]